MKDTSNNNNNNNSNNNNNNKDSVNAINRYNESKNNNCRKFRFKKHIKRTLFFFSITFISFILFSLPIKSAAITVKSWIADLINPVFSIELGDGDLLIDNSEKREEINTDINTGGTTEYSLYDRFGPNISFFCYSGEIKIQTNIVDKIYTFLEDDSFDIGLDDAINLYKEDSHFVNNRVYENRVDISNSVQDPRYVAWCNAVGLGGNVSVANMYLAPAKYMNEIYGMLVSGEISTLMLDGLTTVFDAELMSRLMIAIKPIYALLIIFLLINIARLTYRYLKTASIGPKEIFGKIMYGLLSMAIISALLMFPLKFSPIVKSLVGLKQQIVGDTMEDIIDNEVVNNSENSLAACIWYINIYDPWCTGTYGRTYDKMYTKYAVDYDGKADSDCYPMSDDNILEQFRDELRYSCKQTSGDCKVPLGNDMSVRNWAALGYSIQSKFHIEAISGPNEKIVWPNAETTVKNPNLYIDDFRYIDAMLNISEEYERTGKTTGNIPSVGENAPRVYGTSYMVSNSLKACYRVFILMIPLLLFAIKELGYVLKLAFSSLLICLEAMKYFFHFDEGPLCSAGRKIVDNLLNWILTAFMLYVSFTLYASTYKTFVGNIVYFIICIIMFLEAPALTRRERQAKRWLNNKVNNFVKRQKLKYLERSSKS